MRLSLLFLSLSLGVSARLRAEPASDPSATLSTASTASLDGGAALLGGLSEGVSYTLVALEPLGEGALAVFSASADGARVSLELTGEAARIAGRTIGAVLEPVAVAGGTLLQLGGEVIAFVPNQLVRDLHHRKRVRP